MENINEKEFAVGDIMTLKILRKEFDELGTIHEMKIKNLVQSNHIIVMSFYKENMMQISQKNLLVLCNCENIIFDNILLIISLKNKSEIEYKIKCLNKEINYMKIHISGSLNSSRNGKDLKICEFTKIFDFKNLKFLQDNEIDSLNLSEVNNSLLPVQNNDNLNFILSEINKINKNLEEEENDLESKKRNLLDKEEKINKKIYDFKNEMMLLGEKYYGECLNEINERINEISKKVNNCENNIMNKYKILKEKLRNENSKENKINNISQGNNRDKIANLEIKIKYLEDSNNALKKSLFEKEELLKEYINNEEKLTKKLKQLKDETVLLKSELKEKNNEKNNDSSIQSEKESLQNSKISVNIKAKGKTNPISNYELNKIQIESLSNNLFNSVLFEINTKSKEDTFLTSLLLMNAFVNPIILYNKFEYAYILLFLKLSKHYLTSNNNFFCQISSVLSDLLKKFPEFKENLLLFLKNKKENDERKNIDLIEMNIDIENQNRNFSRCLYNKFINFENFLNKIINKNDTQIMSTYQKNNILISKYILASNSMILILCSYNIKNININILNIIKKFLMKKDESVIKFLVKSDFLQILIKIFSELNPKEINKNDLNEYTQLLVDIFLLLVTFGYIKKKINFEFLNSFLFNKPNSILFFEFLKTNLKFKSEEEMNNKNFIKSVLFLSNIILIFPDAKKIFQMNLKDEFDVIKKVVFKSKKEKTNVVFQKNRSIIMYKNIYLLIG